MAILGLAVAGAVIASGVLSESGPDERAGAGSEVTTDADPPDPPTRRTVITLGNLDPPPTSGTTAAAPFDPCTVIGWADLPAEVRPTGTTAPRPAIPHASDEFAVGCRFDNSHPAPTTGPDRGDSGTFTVTVGWGTAPPLSLNPADHPGGTAALFGGRPGIQRPGVNPHRRHECTGLMPAARGVAGVTVTNTRFPQTDPCAVAASALDAIARTVP